MSNKRIVLYVLYMAAAVGFLFGGVSDPSNIPFADRWADACRDLKCSTFANQIEEFGK